MPRDYNHDYRSRCIYHITMMKAHGVPDFSRISGTPESPVVERSALGSIIERQIRSFSDMCPALSVVRYVVMPDHLHFAIFVKERLPVAVGSYIGMMKVQCGKLAREKLGITPPLFEDDFHDRMLRRSHRLSTICRYINQNPYRLLVRRFNPDFFSRINNIELDGRLWQMYGNMHLMDNPFKAPVVIHRADPQELLAAKQNRWRHLAENGGVLVSPFISQAEKDVRRRCEETGGKIILLSPEPFGERAKPSGRDFELCAAGRMLIVAPMQPLLPGRATFLYLNSMAEAIALKH